METKLYKIIETNDNRKKLAEIAQIIKDSGLVAIPTETVYGLAANGLDGIAIKKIFEAKNRPMDNPLILHISHLDQLDGLSTGLKESDRKILEKLWPGPLTVILKKSDKIPDEVSAGLDTVAIRLPKKKLTRDFIDACGVPLAAPSANLSTKPSPTNARDVYEDMNGRIDAIIDGGSSSIGIESTVLDLTSQVPTILRPGFYTAEDLEKYWPKVNYDLSLKDDNQAPKSPGQKYKHYAPKAKVEVYVGSSKKFSQKLDEIIKNRHNNIGIMMFEEDEPKELANHTISMGSSKDLRYMGNVLFTGLREMDHKSMDLVIVHGVEEKGYGLSIMNRLKKAASGNVYNLGGKMKIAITSDHAGVELKSTLKEYIEDKGLQVDDIGPFSTDSVDYPDYAQDMCKKVVDKEVDLGIAICGTGVGMSIACNKVKGIRASLCSEPVSAELTRRHNDSNVLCLGARTIGTELAKGIVDAYLAGEFEGGRHQNRIDKLEGGSNE